jgi:hypothetical protein
VKVDKGRLQGLGSTMTACHGAPGVVQGEESITGSLSGCVWALLNKLSREGASRMSSGGVGVVPGV